MDSRLRRLHRAAASGDPEAMLQLEIAKWRIYQIPNDHIKLLAHLNFQPALHHLGWQQKDQQAEWTENPTGDPERYVDPNGRAHRVPQSIGALRDIFDRWQQHEFVRIAYFACRGAEHRFSQEKKTDVLGVVLGAVQAWLDDPNVDTRNACSSLIHALRGTGRTHTSVRPMPPPMPDPSARYFEGGPIVPLEAEPAPEPEDFYGGVYPSPPEQRSCYDYQNQPVRIEHSLDYTTVNGICQILSSIDGRRGSEDYPVRYAQAASAGNAIAFAAEVIGPLEARTEITNRTRAWILAQAEAAANAPSS